jgi:hypothetical protein
MPKTTSKIIDAIFHINYAFWEVSVGFRIQYPPKSEAVIRHNGHIPPDEIRFSRKLKFARWDRIPTPAAPLLAGVARN